MYRERRAWSCRPRLSNSLRTRSQCAPSVFRCAAAIAAKVRGRFVAPPPRATTLYVARLVRGAASVRVDGWRVLANRNNAVSRPSIVPLARRRRGAPAGWSMATASASEESAEAPSSPRTKTCSRGRCSRCCAQRPDRSGRVRCACERRTWPSRRGETRAGALTLVGASGAYRLAQAAALTAASIGRAS